MARRVFFSFKYDDIQKVMTVRNSWRLQGIESAGFVDAAQFEEVEKQGVAAIKRWINEQLEGTSVTVVLVGKSTYESKYVTYEIEESIKKRNGLIAIYINNIKDFQGNVSLVGANPFEINFGFIPMENPVYPCCNYYDWVEDDGYNNLGKWIEKAAKEAGR